MHKPAAIFAEQSRAEQNVALTFLLPARKWIKMVELRGLLSRSSIIFYSICECQIWHGREGGSCIISALAQIALMFISYINICPQI